MTGANGSTVRRRNKPPSKGPPSEAQVNEKYPPQAPYTEPFQIKPIFAFYILFTAHTLAAFYHPIQDCDEVFNYWEPSHYLNHGHAFQTWEYSPVYAIRSWAYAGLHALIMFPGRYLPLGDVPSETVEFYLLRITLGFICAICETRLFSKISATLNPRIAVTFLFIMATSPGIFHASISYLPSSFSMYTIMLGMAAFMDWRGGLRTAQGILAMGAGAVLGWPFSAALAIPFLLEEFMFANISDKDGMIELFWRLVDGTVRALLVLALQVAIDVFFYKKLVVVPWNIVWYNVFSGRGGPDLYGTEPWHFYLRNLFLNFHVWLLLALVSMPLLLLQHLAGVKGATKASYLRGIVFLSPFYFWLAIFTLQPHKEERFMYPAYPALALNAAVSLHVILANFGSTDPKDTISKIPVQLRLTAILAFVASALGLSVFRTLGTITAFNAPLSIYSPLHSPSLALRSSDVVCLGKEWYRFPSHYLLPLGMHAKFIKSEFGGLLPGEFHEGVAGQGLGLFPGAWLEPPGMNDENREDMSKYTDVKFCTYMVDFHAPSTETTKLEPAFVEDAENWERMKCLPFLDAASTGVVGRMGWVPDLPFIPPRIKRTYGEYCLLKRKKRQGMEHRTDAVPKLLETMG